MSRSQWIVAAVIGVVLVVGVVVCGCFGCWRFSYLLRGRGTLPGSTPDATATGPTATIDTTAPVPPPTDTPVDAPTPTATITRTPTHRPSPSATDTRSPTPTNTPTKTPTPTPSPTPTHSATLTRIPPETAPVCIPCGQAGSHIGEYGCVCCTIVRTYYCSSCSDQPTFLNSHDPYKGYFTAVVWGENRQAFIDHFGSPPESVFRNRFSCFCGLIEYYAPNQAPEIPVRNPANACVDCADCGR